MIHETFTLPSHNKFKPELFTYILKSYPNFSGERLRPFVLIVPGGGYDHYGQREQESIAIKMNSLGFHAAVLHYSLAPDMKFPEPVLDLAEAVAFIRNNAKKWNIDDQKIIISGFSAGGHVAATLGAYWNTKLFSTFTKLAPHQIRPNALILNYPVITADERFSHKGSIKNLTQNLSKDEISTLCSITDTENINNLLSIEKHITKDFPPSFIWHTLQDEAVPPENTIQLVSSLKEAGIDFEYHLFNRGKHGLALSSPETANPDGSNAEKECEVWPELFKNWFQL